MANMLRLIAIICCLCCCFCCCCCCRQYAAATAFAKANDDLDYAGKIVNGTKAKPGEFPFAVSLRRIANGRHFCGASLLNSGWALTAAHCVAKAQPGQVNLQYGSTTLSRNATKLANVTRFYVHRSYAPAKKYVNDIALLQLADPVLPFDSHTAAVRLPEPAQQTPENTSAMLIGWGLNATGGIVQRHLQKVNLQTVGDDACSARHGTQLYATQLCAGVLEGGKGQCNGDSGGPLLWNGTQIGIVSWSRKPCAVAPYPGVFTEVSAYIDWIVETLEQASAADDLAAVPTRLLVGDLIIERRGTSPLLPIVDSN